MSPALTLGGGIRCTPFVAGLNVLSSKTAPVSRLSCGSEKAFSRVPARHHGGKTHFRIGRRQMATRTSPSIRCCLYSPAHRRLSPHLPICSRFIWFLAATQITSVFITSTKYPLECLLGESPLCCLDLKGHSDASNHHLNPSESPGLVPLKCQPGSVRRVGPSTSER